MGIWIDEPMWPRHGTVFAHLVSDTSLEELHAFASRAGMHPRAFHGDHYDIPRERYGAALAAGAVPVTGAELVRLLSASGLRLRKRRGDHPVARVQGMVFPDGTVAHVDLVASPRPMTVPGVFAAMVFVQDAVGRFAVVHSPRRESWGSPGGWLELGESAVAGALREVAEETGIGLSHHQIEACGYERFEVVHRPDGARWPPGRSYLQLFRARLDVPGPQLAGSLDDVDGWRWVDRGEFEVLCGGEFWWPLVPALFG